MPSKKSLIRRFLIWRYKFISQKNFILLLSILIGLLAGLVSVTLKNITYTIESIFEEGIVFSQNQLYFILPFFGLLLVYLFVKYIAKQPIEHGIPSVLYSLSKRGGILSHKKIYHPLITAPLTVGFGGSVGLLGPAIVSGASLSSNLSQLFHIDKKTRTLLIACASAGAIASIFKSPIAAILFAVEVFSLDLTFASLLPLLIASVSSVLTSYFFLGNEVLFNFKIIETFDLKDTLFYLILGVGTALGSIYFSKIYFLVLDLFNKLKTPMAKLAVGGLAIGIMLYFIPPLYGEGFSFINNLLADEYLLALGKTPFDNYTENIWVVILLLIGITVFKAIAMTTTFAAGGTGGIIIPSLVMGSALGNVVAKIINNIGLGFHVSEANFTLVGMAGLIAGVLHAPLTAIFLIAEITGGYELFVPLMLTVSMSFILTKNTLEYSIYTKELAEKGALLTHDKDKSVLTLMDIDSVIEKNFAKVFPRMYLGEIVNKAVVKSKRNIFPVVNPNSETLVGVILLDDIRNIMFDRNLYNEIVAKDIMQQPPEIIDIEKDKMTAIMQKFQDSNAWNLPVVRNGKYIGFISKSKLLTAYRRKLINITH